MQELKFKYELNETVHVVGLFDGNDDKGRIVEYLIDLSYKTQYKVKWFSNGAVHTEFFYEEELLPHKKGA